MKEQTLMDGQNQTTQALWLVCVCSVTSVMSDCATLGTVARQTPDKILHRRILEWIAVPPYRGTSCCRDETHVPYVSCIGRWTLYHECHLGRLVCNTGQILTYP